ncbi:MAG: Rne/Rng family ribonuclease [Alphaproteobacteria bacterium]|nr:Rne/Rng family ribonuclease [Alphaproteobacteria bacterium]
MTKRMLIDATHAEETRVAVVDDGRLTEFDYESAFRKPLKGNIYLAKVTRVEPSLQAAFVSFGGNRHGFLPFSEIHPDYFRIPIADREALIAEQEAALRRAEEAEAQAEAEDAKHAAENGEEGENTAPDDGIEEIEDDRESVEEVGGDMTPDPETETESETNTKRGGSSKAKPKPRSKAQAAKQIEVTEKENAHAENDDGSEDEDEINGNFTGHENLDTDADDHDEDEGPNGNVRDDHENAGGTDQDGQERNGSNNRYRRGGRRGHNGRNHNGSRGRNTAQDSRRTEKVGGESIDEEQRFRFNLRRKYKIQEVIKRGQIMLVQVSKEERGNKGAAVGTYLSLPGRYCVLMPNSPRGGGVSRKIASYKDRAHMRQIMKDLDVPKGMSVILRTAGVSRTKAEIKRDLDYLMRLWDGIRELTLESTAPALVYEEANLVKRAVRDLYSRDIDEVHVAGEEGYKTARDFMKRLTPSHVKKVIEFKNQPVPLFNFYKIEGQIAEIGEPQVTLPSGGYLVISPTEALVSVDVNSGKATKERHIEETALRTNLEAADEVARQLRLRDLGGLVVVDFIDMEDRRNNAKLERRMRDALSTDRARIQMGRISSFGLMELSRQRMSPSLGESQYEICDHCHGVGRVRTADAASILVLRSIEEEGLKGRAAQIIAHVSGPVALYIMNHKRQNLSELEQRYKLTVLLRIDETLGAAGFRTEVAKPATKDEDGDNDGDDDNTADSAETATPRAQNEDDGQQGPRNARRRGRRGGRRRGGREERSDSENGAAEQSGESQQNQAPQGAEAMQNEETVKIIIADPAQDSQAQPSTQDEAAPKKKPTRSRRPAAKNKTAEKEAPAPLETASSETAPLEAATATPSEEAPKAEKAKTGRAAAAKTKVEKPAEKTAPKKSTKEASAKTETANVPPSNDDRRPAEPPKPAEYEVITESTANKKKGWWNRLVE